MRITYIPTILFVILFIGSLMLKTIFGDFEEIDGPSMGFVLFLIGLSISVYSRILLWREKPEMDPETGTPKSILKKGIFKYSRNPVYLGQLTMLTGAAIFLNVHVIYLIPVVYFLFVEIAIIKTLEQRMQKKFGNEYEEYKKKSHRWF